MIILGDCHQELAKLEANSIDCVITSPPYWGLRDYGVDGQLGLEPSYADYIEHLCSIFDEVRRVLKPTGTCWVNLGDTYGGSNGAGYSPTKWPKLYKDGGQLAGKLKERASTVPKCLLQIPARFAIAMIDRGWILRNEIIWYKPNAMPQSVKDRFTVDYEKIYFFTKSQKYYFEQEYEPHITFSSSSKMQGGRNKRSVWAIPTKPFQEAHFAVFPEKLVEPMIKAGCPKLVCVKCGEPQAKIMQHTSNYDKRESAHQPNNTSTKVDSTGWSPPTIEHVGYSDCGCGAGYKPGIVLDPFCGSGTTGVVAKKQNVKFTGIELNEDYVKLAAKRIANTTVNVSLF